MVFITDDVINDKIVQEVDMIEQLILNRPQYFMI